MSETTYSPSPVGFVFKMSDGSYMLKDSHGLILPDVVVEKTRKSGISEADYDAAVERELQRLYAPTEPAPRVLSSGFIYAVKVGSKIKMGRTKDLESRFRAYKKVSWNFEIIATAEVIDTIAEEKGLLEHFGGEAGKNEWIEHTPQLEIEVREYFEVKNA